MGDKPFKKSTDAEVSARVTTVTGYLMDGYTKSDIIRFTSSWSVSSRQIETYIAQATAAIKEVNQLTLQENQGMILRNLWQLFKDARIAEDRPEQHKVLMSIAKLKGLDQMTVNHFIEDKRELAEMSDEELEAIIVEPCPQLGS